MVSRNIARGFVVLVVVAIAGCTSDAVGTASPGDAVEGDGVAKIGLLAPLTGSVAADGEEYQRGAELAVDEINAAGGCGGYTLELVVGDTGDLSPDETSTAIQRVAGDPDVNVFMTGYANLSNFEIDTMADMGIPYFVTGNATQTKDIITQDPDRYVGIYSLSPDYDVYGTGLRDWIASIVESGEFEPRSETFFTVTSDNPYSRSLSEGMTAGLEELGWERVGDEVTPTQDISDWRSVLASIRSADPDLVINTDFTPGNEAAFLKQFLESPTQSILYLDYAPALPEFTELTGDDSTGVVSAVAGAPIQSLDRTQEIQAKFEDEYGVRSGKYGIALYESVYIYCDAVEEVGDPTDRSAIGEAIGRTDKDIAMGRLVFDPETHLAQTGEGGYPFPIWQVWDQELVLVSPEDYATGEFQMPPWMSE